MMLELLARDLVLGDIVYISLGDRVPADIRLMEVRAVWLPARLHETTSLPLAGCGPRY